MRSVAARIIASHYLLVIALVLQEFIVITGAIVAGVVFSQQFAAYQRYQGMTAAHQIPFESSSIVLIDDAAKKASEEELAAAIKADKVYSYANIGGIAANSDDLQKYNIYLVIGRLPHMPVVTETTAWTVAANAFTVNDSIPFADIPRGAKYKGQLTEEMLDDSPIPYYDDILLYQIPDNKAHMISRINIVTKQVFNGISASSPEEAQQQLETVLAQVNKAGNSYLPTEKFNDLEVLESESDWRALQGITYACAGGFLISMIILLVALLYMIDEAVDRLRFRSALGFSAKKTYLEAVLIVLFIWILPTLSALVVGKAVTGFFHVNLPILWALGSSVLIGAILVWLVAWRVRNYEVSVAFDQE